MYHSFEAILLLSIIAVTHLCHLYPACPVACRCWEAGDDFTASCSQGGLTDNELRGLLVALPAQTAILHISGTMSNPNQFSITNFFARFSKLRELHLRHGTIQSLGKHVFADMKTLRTLDVSFNRIEHLAPETFEYTEHLEHLFLDHNHLYRNHLPSSTFFYLERLKTLSLAHNNLTDISGSLFYGLKTLENLNLSGNQLTLSSSLFTEVPNLISLDLSNINLFYLLNDALKDLKKLESLNLSRNLLSVFPGTLVKRMITLRSLDLSRNYIGMIPIDIFAGTALQRLSLSGNILGRSSGSNLERTVFSESVLKELDLSHNGLAQIPYALRHGAPKSLKVLNLSGNPLGKDIQQYAFLVLPNATWTLPMITELHLDNVGLTMLPPSNIPHQFPNLRLLSISQNPLSEQSLDINGLRRLQHLRVLDISGCLFRYGSKELFEHLEEREFEIFDARGNQWDCQHCHVSLLRNLLAGGKRREQTFAANHDCAAFEHQADWLNATCAEPQQLKGAELLALSNHVLPVCSPIFGAVGLSAESEIGIIAAGICGLMLISILIVAVACSYWLPKTIKSCHVKEQNRRCSPISGSSSESSALHPSSQEKLAC